MGARKRTGTSERQAAAQVIRAGLLRLGGSMLGQLLAADRAHAARKAREKRTGGPARCWPAAQHQDTA